MNSAQSSPRKRPHVGTGRGLRKHIRQKIASTAEGRKLDKEEQEPQQTKESDSEASPIVCSDTSSSKNSSASSSSSVSVHSPKQRPVVDAALPANTVFSPTSSDMGEDLLQAEGDSSRPPADHGGAYNIAMVNDEGASVSLGDNRHGNPEYDGTGRFYCSRVLGTHIILGSDGQCGPHGGPQCGSCRRFQDSMAQRSGAAAVSERDLSPPPMQPLLDSFRDHVMDERSSASEAHKLHGRASERPTLEQPKLESHQQVFAERKSDQARDSPAEVLVRPGADAEHASADVPPKSRPVAPESERSPHCWPESSLVANHGGAGKHVAVGRTDVVNGALKFESASIDVDAKKPAMEPAPPLGLDLGSESHHAEVQPVSQEVPPVNVAILQATTAAGVEASSSARALGHQQLHSGGTWSYEMPPDKKALTGEPGVTIKSTACSTPRCLEKSTTILATDLVVRAGDLYRRGAFSLPEFDSIKSCVYHDVFNNRR